MKQLQITNQIARLLVWILLGALVISCNTTVQTINHSPSEYIEPVIISLPEPKLTGGISLEDTLQKRRSVREYTSEPLMQGEVSQIVWAAQGKTTDWGGRTAPSAGALYPLELYVIVGNVQGLSTGVYKYKPEKHELNKTKNEDIRDRLSQAALDQVFIKHGAISLIISGSYGRTTAKYGDRGIRYVQMEAGHAAQNVCLQVTALGLGAVTVGAFNDSEVKDVAGLSEDESPLYIIPVGRKAD
jgi:SagB-type dehydrogenase family enzyme